VRGALAVPKLYQNSRKWVADPATSDKNGGRSLARLRLRCIDRWGKFVIDRQFDGLFTTGEFREGLTAVEIDGKCGFINKKGQVVIPLTVRVEHFLGVLLDRGNERVKDLQRMSHRKLADSRLDQGRVTRQRTGENPPVKVSLKRESKNE